MTLDGVFPQDPLFCGKVAVESLVAIFVVLFFNFKAGLESRYVVYGNVGSEKLDASHFVFVTPLSHGTNVVGGSVVVFDGNDGEDAREIEVAAMLPILELQGKESVLDFSGGEAKTALRQELLGDDTRWCVSEGH